MRHANLLWALGAATILPACVEETRYAIERKSVEMEADAEPAFVNENDDPVFVAQRRFGLQITAPQQGDLDRLGQGAQGMDLPFPRLPWLEREDLEIQVDYALENHGTTKLSALIFLDGINEFHAYRPGPEDFHQWERRIELEGGERVSASITELEMDEIAIDLATVVNEAPNSNLVVQFQSQSTRDPRVKKYIPKVVPGLVAFRMGLQTGEAAALELRVSVRVQDHGGRIAARGEEAWELPQPADFVPIAPEEDQ
jgi:hypothetical protein